MKQNIGDYFWDDLTELIQKYEGQEMTNAEAVGYLMFKVNEIMTQSSKNKSEAE